MWELFLRDSVLIQTWELFYLFWIMEFFFVIIWTIEDRGSISATMNEYAIPTMCERWSNKNKTCQLKNAS